MREGEGLNFFVAPRLVLARVSEKDEEVKGFLEKGYGEKLGGGGGACSVPAVCFLC